MVMSKVDTTCADFTPLLVLNSDKDSKSISETLDKFMGSNVQLLDHINKQEELANKTGSFHGSAFRFIAGVGRDERGKIATAQAMIMMYKFS